MRRLAHGLGVSAMAPDRHVGSRDELPIVLVDRLAARSPIPAPGRAEGRDAGAVVDDLRLPRGAPWVPEVLARRRLMAPSVLGAIEEIHAALCDAGLSIEAAVRAYRLMWNFTLGSLSEMPRSERPTGHGRWRCWRFLCGCSRGDAATSDCARDVAEKRGPAPR